jgi:anti-sigma-K factor RskA
LDCIDRKDQILLLLAGALDESEAVELRRHLATGCPECAAHYAEAEATLAMLPLSLDEQTPPARLRQAILKRAESMRIGAIRIGSWDRVVLSAAIAAVLAVAVTLALVNQLWPRNQSAPSDHATLADLQAQLTLAQGQVTLAQGQLASMRQTFQGMKFAELTGANQPEAVGRVFIDMQMNKWYFFTCGMKPAQGGKTYALWLICNDQKIPAGTFNVGQQGTATLLGAVPALPPNAAVSLAITDEPADAPHKQPTGSLQMKGIVE